MDCFPPTSDPGTYVPRPATEELLAALDAAFADGTAIVTLSGPAGLGKTLLLRLAEQRWEPEVHCLHLPYASLTTSDLAYWCLGLLRGEPSKPEEAENEFLEWIRASERPLILLIDDASALPVETARAVVGWLRALDGALRLVVAMVDDERSGAVLGVFDPALRLRLASPMSEAETRAYVFARTAQGDDEDRAVYSREVVAWMHRESAGNPRLLHMLATWKRYSDRPVPGTIGAGEDDGWLDLDEGDDHAIEAEGPAPAAAEASMVAELTATQPVSVEGADEAGAFARRRRRRQRR